jgi:hypothetical protein
MAKVQFMVSTDLKKGTGIRVTMRTVAENIYKKEKYPALCGKQANRPGNNP